MNDPSPLAPGETFLPEPSADPSPVEERPWPADVPKGPLDDKDLGAAGTVNADGYYVTYPADSPEGIPGMVADQRANRPRWPKDVPFVVNGPDKDKYSLEQWAQIAQQIMDDTGDVPRPYFQEDIAAKSCMIESYTTLQRIKMALTTCEEMINDKDLGQQARQEWMRTYGQMLQMHKEHLQELKHSAKVADEKQGKKGKKNLPPMPPPSVVIQQNFSNGNGGNGRNREAMTVTEALPKSIDEAKPITET